MGGSQPGSTMVNDWPWEHSQGCAGYVESLSEWPQDHLEF
jgi:hypothetical protein